MASKYDHLLPLKDQVLYELGRCVLNLQLFELSAKRLLLGSKLTTHLPTLEKHQRVVGKATLGGLLAQLLDSFSSHDDYASITPQTESQEPLLSFEINRELTEEELQSLEVEFAELVSARNELIHHFQLKHDLSCDKGCEKALTFLASLNARAIQMISFIREHQKITHKTIRLGLNLYEDGTIDRLAQGSPTGADWLFISEVRGLIEAVELLGIDGATPLGKAIEHLEKKGIAKDAYALYNCKSWPDLMAKSGLFRLEKRKNHTLNRWEHWYLPSKSPTELAVIIARQTAGDPAIDAHNA